MYQISDFKYWIDKAKTSRNLHLLGEVHDILLEHLRHLQEQHERNIRKRNYTLKKEIEQLELLNLSIFSIFAYLDSNPKPKVKRM